MYAPLVVGLTLSAGLVAGCAEAPAVADGPRMQVCGQWIGRAEMSVGSGPFYIDASRRSAVTIRAATHSSGTWLRLSADCSVGARVVISDRKVIGVASALWAKDGHEEAVLLNPGRAGRAIVTACVPGRRPHTIAVVVR